MVKRYSDIESMGDDHYDVGIIGVWFGENYGSTLTYYALQKAIRDMGYSTIMLEKPAKPDDPELNESIHSRVFAKEHYQAIAPLLSLDELSLLNSHCDTYVVGCDQVWSYNISRHFGKSFYLSFAGESNRRVSYGSSFGQPHSGVPLQELSDITKLYHSFDSISVRESDAVDILFREFGVQGTQVVDPVFLIDKRNYFELARAKDVPDEPYVLAYILDPKPEIGEMLKEFAKRRNCRLLVVLDARTENIRADEAYERRIKDLGVAEAIPCPDATQWLSYIMHADFVVTDSFHGACFSIIFEKQFVAIGNKNRGISRANTLVDIFQLRQNYAIGLDTLRKRLEAPKPIEYDKVNEIYAFEQNRSLQWLRNALGAPLIRAGNVSSLSKKECCGCGSCCSVCPVEAIAMQPDQEGFLYPHVDGNACTNCGLCKKKCPSINPRSEKWKTPLTLAGYTDDAVRNLSSSGGIFSLLAELVIAEKGVVCGAAFDDDLRLMHVIVDKIEDLAPLRMSKYMQSETANTYREVKAVLDSGFPALYVGCPCQIAGLESFLGKDYDNLISVDLLCHGGPSQAVFRKYLKEVHAGKEITYVGFRDKDYYGWSTEMTVKYGDGEVYRRRRDEDLFYRAFLPCYSVRPHCQVCNFAKLPRQGDITLGDFWGVARYDSNYTDGNGTSLIAVNSRKGLHALTKLSNRFAVLGGVNMQHILDNGQPFARPFRNNPKRNRFFKLVRDVSLEKAIVCCEQDQFDFGILGMGTRAHAEVLGTYALYTFIAGHNCTALVVKWPYGKRSAIEPSKHYAIRFAHERYPLVSSVEYVSQLPKLNDACSGFIVESRENGYPVRFALNANRELLDVEATTMLPATMLIDGDDYRMLGESKEGAESRELVSLYLSNSTSEQFGTMLKDCFRHEETVTLSAEIELNRLVYLLDASSIVITDDIKLFGICMMLDTPAAFVGDSIQRNRFDSLGLSCFFLADERALSDELSRIRLLSPLETMDLETLELRRRKLADALRAVLQAEQGNRGATMSPAAQEGSHPPVVHAMEKTGDAVKASAGKASFFQRFANILKKNQIASTGQQRGRHD